MARKRHHENSGLSLPLKMPRPDVSMLPPVNHEALEAAFMGRKPAQAYTPAAASSAYTPPSQPQAFSPKIGGSTPPED